MTKLFGDMKSELTARENETCRAIVKEINNFGVSQRQLTMLIYLLALEIEDVEKMQALCQSVKEIVGDDVFVSSVSGGGGG